VAAPDTQENKLMVWTFSSEPFELSQWPNVAHVSKEPTDQQVTQGPMVNQVTTANQAVMEPQVKMQQPMQKCSPSPSNAHVKTALDLQVQPDQKDHQVQLVNQVLQEVTEVQEVLDQSDPLDPKVPTAKLAPREKMDQMAPQVPQPPDQLVNPDQMERTAALDLQERPEKTERLALTEKPETTDHVEKQERLDLKDPKVNLVQTDHLDQKDLVTNAHLRVWLPAIRTKAIQMIQNESKILLSDSEKYNKCSLFLIVVVISHRIL